MKAHLLIPAAALISSISSVALARDLTIISWGGNFQDAQRIAYFNPFTAATNIKTVDQAWDGGVGTLRARAQSGGDPGWDVVHAEVEELQVGCAEGLYEPIDWSKIAEKDKLIPAATSSKCGVGAITWSAGIAYDADKLKPGPTSAVDFFDLQKFPGKRAIRKGPKYALELALEGDGVPVDKIYDVLRTPEGVDRAFNKLKSIRSNSTFLRKRRPGDLAPRLGRCHHDACLQRPGDRGKPDRSP